MSSSNRDDEKKIQEEKIPSKSESIELMHLAMLKKILSEYETYFLASTNQSAANKVGGAKTVRFAAEGDPTAVNKQVKISYKNSAIEQLISSATSLSIDEFAKCLGKLEDFIAVKRNSLDPRDSIGKKLIREIHDNIPELRDSPDYKLGKILAAIDVIRATLKEKKREAKETKDEVRLANIKVVERDIAHLEESLSPTTKNSSSEKLAEFSDLYSGLSRSIQRTGINAGLFSFFSDSPGIVFAKKVEEILPEMKLNKSYGKNSSM